MIKYEQIVDTTVRIIRDMEFGTVKLELTIPEKEFVNFAMGKIIVNLLEDIQQERLKGFADGLKAQ